MLVGHATSLRIVSEKVPPGLGLEINVQLVPFQCSTNGSVTVPPSTLPTARQLVVLAHETRLTSTANAPEGVGLETIDQLVPFHRSISVFCVELVE